MKVQLLYFAGCPNVETARGALARALRAAGLPPQFDEIDVSAPTTPAPLRQWGSPTILVDGVDVGGAAEPTGLTCRLYSRKCCSSQAGAPSETLIRRALERGHRPRRGWLRALAALPAAVLPLLPSFTCPLCLPAYAAVLSSFGLGFVLDNRVQRPLILLFLAVAVGSVAWSARERRARGRLVVVVLASIAVIAGRIVWNIPSLVYAGILGLVAGAVWNMALSLRRRRLRQPRVRPAAHT
ncbi:MAG: hypothetical protein HBSAPP02_28470 [Phycisphaerae bacterium]|nr:MAG: hypothetical protein HBSAPP02_28470 [Phycisphaerae bacterium]